MTVCGFFTILWADTDGYKCEIHGERIAEDLIGTTASDCAACEDRADDDDEYAKCTCCVPDGPQSTIDLGGNQIFGLCVVVVVSSEYGAMMRYDTISMI